MPRCFMAKKLKYPYEQWKLEQQELENSRQITTPSSPNPIKEETQDQHSIIDVTGDVDTKDFSRVPGFTPPAAHLLAAHFSHYGLIAAAATHVAALPPAPLPAHCNSSLTPPPETQIRKKDLFRPYCLDDPSPPQSHLHQQRTPFSSLYSTPSPYLHYRNIEDINTAHAILDLSRRSRSSSPPSQPQEQQPHQTETSVENTSTLVTSNTSSSPVSTSSNSKSHSVTTSPHTPTPLLSPALSTSSSSTAEGQVIKVNQGKTTAYTYEAFFASDGRSKKKLQSGVEPQTSKTRYTCTECGKNYATSSNLSRHKQTHRSLDSNNAKKCHICGKMYVSMPALSMHILTHNLSHKCDVCGKAFSRPWLLQGHMRSHSGDKPYGCAHCGKSFADRSNLRAHMQTHSAFKNFKCKRCNKSFALKSYLNKHYESACFKDQPIPAIDTPPVTPAPSDASDGLASPGATSSYGGDLAPQFSPSNSSNASLSPSSISSLLTTLPSPPPSSASHQITQL